MPEDETNQTPVEEANLPAATEANPEGSPQDGTQEPEATQQTESVEYSAEEIAAFNEQLRNANITDPQGLMSEFTKRSQQLKELERNQQLQQEELDRRNRALAEMAGQQRAAVDPLEAARQEWIAAEQDWQNPERKVAAFENYQRLTNQKFKDQAVLEARQSMVVDQYLDRAKRELNLEYNQNQLNETLERRNPLGLSIMRKFEEGGIEGLKAHLDTLAESRNAESQRKAALNQILGSGGTGVMPGGVVGDTVKPKMDYIEWRGMYNEAARKQLLETHEIVNAPEGFHQ